MESHLLYVHALTPVHVGMGRGAGVIDLPVIRETVTNLPYLPGSSIKGVLREACQDAGIDEAEIGRIFGPEPRRATDASEGDGTQDEAPERESAGTASFTDLRLLFLPVRTGKGLFAWVTSPYVLGRWAIDARIAGQDFDLSELASPGDSEILLGAQSAEKIADGIVELEDLSLTPIADESSVWAVIVEAVAKASLGATTTRSFFLSHVGVVSDTMFGYLARTATEVVARNRLEDDSKTVAQGALWWEESVPAESIFGGLLVATRRHASGIAGLAETLRPALEPILQVGGDASIGRGLAQFGLDGGEE